MGHEAALLEFSSKMGLSPHGPAFGGGRSVYGALANADGDVGDLLQGIFDDHNTIIGVLNNVSMFLVAVLPALLAFLCSSTSFSYSLIRSSSASSVRFFVVEQSSRLPGSGFTDNTVGQLTKLASERGTGVRSDLTSTSAPSQMFPQVRLVVSGQCSTRHKTGDQGPR